MMTLQVEPFRQLVSRLPLPHEKELPWEMPGFSEPTQISVAFGDGIGPEIMEATLRVMEAAGAQLKIDEVQLGTFSAGRTAVGDAFDSIEATKVLFKAPAAADERYKFGSIGTSICKELGLFASIRPCISYHPFVSARQPNSNLVIIKENSEDVHAGVEYRQTDDVYQCLRIVSRSGCERIIRLAFDFAARTGRRKVSCFTNSRTMKLTDGLFDRVFNEVADQYPQVDREILTVDTEAARLVKDPSRFDVVVAPNMHGNILSSTAGIMAAPPGCAHQAHLGTVHSMFEAAHGPVTALTASDAANPSGLMLSGVMMLLRIGQFRAAELIHNGWLRTVEDGFHTADMFAHTGYSRRRVGTAAFADAVIANLGERPSSLRAVEYRSSLLRDIAAQPKLRSVSSARKRLVGLDVFVHWRGVQSRALAETMRCALDDNLELALITSRGVKVWPGGGDNTQRTDHWCCRYRVRPGRSISHADIAELQSKLGYLGVDFIKTDHLYEFDGQPGFTAESEI